MTEQDVQVPVNLEKVVQTLKGRLSDEIVQSAMVQSALEEALEENVRLRGRNVELEGQLAAKSQDAGVAKK